MGKEITLPVFTIKDTLNHIDEYGGKGCCVSTTIIYNACHHCPMCKYDIDIDDVVSCTAIRIEDAR